MSSANNSPRASMRKKLLLALFALLLAFGLAELALMFFYRPAPSIRFQQDVGELNRMGLATLANVVVSDDELFWRLTPSTQLPPNNSPFFGIISNEQGLREDHLIEATDDAPRVLFLGDSCTFGYGLTLREGYVDQTEQRLRKEKKRNVECINAGVPGYTLFQGWRFWETRGKALKPQIVVACFGWNDLSSWDGQSDFDHHDYNQRRQPVRWLRWSRSCQLVTRMLAKKPESEGRRPRLLPAEFGDLLGRLKQSVEDSGARFVIMVWPVRPQIDQQASPSPWQQAAYDFAARTETTSIDLVPHFKEWANSGGAVPLFIDNGHGTALANQHIGTLLADKLERMLFAAVKAQRP